MSDDTQKLGLLVGLYELAISRLLVVSHSVV